MSDGSIAKAVDRGDLDELTRLVDGLCSSRDWPGALELRDRCRHALERGLQLWPAAEYAEYRVALEGPGEFAGPLVTEEAGRFALGPLWEVAASTHSWTEIRDHVPPGPARSLAAQERVLRGEDLRGDDSIDGLVIELPLTLETWEPSYQLATYRAAEAEFPSPDPAAMSPLTTTTGRTVEDPEVVEALLAVAATWVEQSNGAAAAVAVEGGAEAAVGSLGHEAAAASVPAQDGVAWLAWAGASGGAYGRRRGGPMGRFAVWWLLSVLAGIDWPPEPGELGDAAEALRWTMWEPRERHGWSACIAIEEEGRAWALYAVDDHREEDRTHVR